MNTNKKKVKFKKGIFQKLFWVLSILVIFLILVIFIIRFIVVNSIYGGSDKRISDYIVNNMNKEDGLYKENGEYIFKGKVDNNYLEYNNLLYRVVKIYKDGSVEIVLEDGINSLYYDEENVSYIKSDIHKYLNDIYMDKLVDKEDVNKGPICLDMVNNIENITCNDIDYSSYVKLLMVGDYVNSILDGESYLNKDGEYYYLGNNSSKGIWILNGENLSISDTKNAYKVRPVITLKNTSKYISGKGSLEEPFIIKNSEYVYGEYVKIENDTYIVIDQEKSYLKLMLVEDSPLVRYTYNDKLLDKLNDDWYENLSYKKILSKYTINYGEYKDSYKDIRDKKKSVYVGMATINDFKFDKSDYDYLLVNKNGELVFYYQDGLYKSPSDLARKVRPVIMIKSNLLDGGIGTIEEPYLVEVK